MSKKVNPAAVGIFVTGALVLLLASLVILGAGKLFEKKEKFVLYFQSSTNGLDEGSPVQLGGVKVGSVVKMYVQIDPKTKKKVIPVVIELSADRLAALTVDQHAGKNEILSKESIMDFVKNKGLRGRLINKSALTGQLFVDLDFFPDDDGGYRFSGPTIDGLTQIPTTKSQIQRVLESIAEGVDKLAKIDVANLVGRIDDLLVNLDAKVTQLDMKGLSDKANSTLEKIDSAVANLDKLVTGEDVKEAVANLNEASAELKELLAAIDGEKINLAVANAAETLENANGAIRQIGGAAENIADLTNPNAAGMARLNRALSSLEETSRSIKELTDFLKRNPKALISGKKRP